MRLVVGLGNPGEKYKNVRHNLGFMVVDEYVSRVMGQGSMEDSKKFKSQIVKIGNVTVAKPQTYMNNSGLAVKLLTTYYHLPATDVIIIHDDLDLPLGKIKIRIGGAAAGHHGVESIIEALKTDKFIRVRLGIGNLKTLGSEHKIKGISTEKFVLEPFTHPEQPQVKHMIKQALKALETLLEKGLEVAQNQFN